MATSITTDAGTLDTWAILELFGHKRLAGKISEHVLGSSALIRCDVPATETLNSDGTKRETAAYSKLVGPGAIYCITPCTEEVARLAAKEIERYNDPIPVSMPKQILARVESTVGADPNPYSSEEDDDDEYDDEEPY
jgi:hypothetical protein